MANPEHLAILEQGVEAGREVVYHSARLIITLIGTSSEEIFQRG